MQESVENSLGICLGASTVSMVEVEHRGISKKIVNRLIRPHQGDVRGCLTGVLREIKHLADKKMCVTGRKFRNSLNLSSICEPEATELAVRHILPTDHPYRVVVSAGGETFMVYHLNRQGFIENIQTGNKCASGTGEFFLQQLRRMDIPLEAASDMAHREDFFKISGRCSVFCKSDCTHALNKGIAKSTVVSGLTSMMAGKLDELVKKISADPVLLVGGCANNQGMVHFLRQKIDHLFIPEEASCFEALGAALWALEHTPMPYPGVTGLFSNHIPHFSFHEPLSRFRHRVHYKSRPHGRAEPGDRAILGLDVGSTTTKGILLRRRDKAVLASAYLRTKGDPVRAARNVYQFLHDQLKVPLFIEAMGVTGSGRQIAGLHAMTPGVINEIIAHATAAAFYDEQVDTILEIGGQDAKYTFLTNGVPNDYAMNEACSAGTGSFLEESARESLGLEVEEIGDVAFRGENPPNFSDQCAAFISSDIKNAVQNRISVENIVAGLVYSVCLNFINRVKGNRPVGKKIFIQGGVCYNHAVPVAMAALTGKEVIVPPDPGLTGAFGVALEVEKRLDQGLLKPGLFDLKRLAAREVAYEKPFVCAGGRENCDRKCEISRISIDGKTYPFGGVCNRYDNILRNTGVDVATMDLVKTRQNLIFALEKEGKKVEGPAVRMNRSFLLNTYYPFFKRFFNELGFNLVLPDVIDPSGIARRGAQFCYPAELAHGYLADMLTRKADFTFLPHLKGVPSGDSEISCTCVFVQGEPFYLKSTFRELDTPATLSPTIDFTDSYPDQEKVFSDMAVSLGMTRNRGKLAFAGATAEQADCHLRLKAVGREFLSDLEKNPHETAVVLFGRPYNSFTVDANKGIPLKFATRGVRIIPFDMLPYENERLDEESNMFWAMGNALLRCARFVARHPQLFATFITNFSCGPDSFIITYFRDTMGAKPSLTLELDSHTADAGIETRIEAFLDIIGAYRNLPKTAPVLTGRNDSVVASMAYRKKGAAIRTSSGECVPLTDKRVRMLIPAMGKFGSALLAGAFASVGIQAETLPAADAEVLKLGRGNSSCKECLPLQTTVGSILDYLGNHRPKDEITAFLMPSAPGPCRFGQYNVLARRLIAEHNIPDIVVFSPTSKNCYGGLGTRFYLAAWRAIIIGDLFDEMWSTLLTAAVDKNAALGLLQSHYQAILKVMDKDWKTLVGRLKQCSGELGTIALATPYEEIPKITLAGEIYVRHDPISLQQLVEKMAGQGFIVRTAQNSEWFKYIDWLITHNIMGEKSIKFQFLRWIKEKTDKKIRELLAPAGLFHHGDMRVGQVVDLGAQYVSPQVRGEAILTIGSAFHDILSPSCGIISIGPFGCMPNRVAEAVLQEKFTASEKRKQLNGHALSPILLNGDRKFPFLAIETDGTPFPQIIEARLEAFCLQAQRLHKEMLSAGDYSGILCRYRA
ncbi:MAG: acyl-CoA dehydratase activase [Pseudomonadota bacterium]